MRDERKPNAAALVALALCVVLGGCGKMEKQQLEPGREEYLRVAAPEGWSELEGFGGLSPEQRRVYGTRFLGPVSPDGLPCLISAHYYAPGNVVHETAEKFLSAHAGPILGVNFDGKEYGEVTADKVAGRPAKVLERMVYEYVPPESVKQRKIEMYELYTVIPAGRGYYVLKFSAPAQMAQANFRAYKEVLDSFKPLVGERR